MPSGCVKLSQGSTFHIVADHAHMGRGDEVRPRHRSGENGTPRTSRLSGNAKREHNVQAKDLAACKALYTAYQALSACASGRDAEYQLLLEASRGKACCVQFAKSPMTKYGVVPVMFRGTWLTTPGCTLHPQICSQIPSQAQQSYPEPHPSRQCSGRYS